MLRVIVVTIGILFAGSALAADPIADDPVVDSAHPPTFESLRIPAEGGAQLNAFIYRAGGAGRRPVVVLCHGYPGNERNLDLAQTLRRAGYHVLYFDYRGSWGVDGNFTLGHGLEDARSVLAFVRSAGVAEKYGFDPAKVAVVGHSYGGWVALMLAATDAELQAVAALCAWNMPVDLKVWASDAAGRAKLVASLGTDFDDRNGPLRGGSGESIFREIEQHRVDYDYFRRAPDMKNKSLLLIVGSGDTDQPLPDYHEPLVRALKAEKARHLEVEVYDDDHAISAHRNALVRRILTWLPGALASRP